MSALPSGWIDTGKLVSHVGSFTIDVAAVFGYGSTISEIAEVAGIWLGIDVSGSYIPCGDFGSSTSVSLYVRRNADAYAARTVIDTVAGACPQPRLSCPVTVTFSNLRLGFTHRVTTASRLNVAEYGLFADAGSTVSVTVGGLTTTTAYVTPTLVDVGTTVDLWTIFASGPALILTGGINFTNIVWNGESDPNGTLVSRLQSHDFPGSHGIYASYDLYPPLKYDANVRVEDAHGSVPALSVRVGDFGATGPDTIVANGATAHVNYWRWRDLADDSLICGAISGGYTAGGIATSVVPVPIRRLRPKRSQLAPEDFAPLTLSIASPVDILLSANNWSGSGSVALSGTGNKTWTVTGSATVTRILAATYSSADSYTTTLHTAGEDVWGWGLYSYLTLNITSNAVATLTVTVNYVTDNALGTTTARTYTVPVTATTADYRLDLLFPNEGGPDYWERAKSIQVATATVGVYTLNSAKLTAVENAYVKADARVTGATDYWSGLTLVQDGSMPAYFWGPNDVLSGSIRKKDDETGLDGAASTANGGCFKMNSTISALATELNRMEGVTAVYDGTGIDADLLDSDGNVCGIVNGAAAALTYMATWLNTVMGGRVAPNATLTLYASLPIDRIQMCPVDAGVIVLPFRVVVGMMLEGLCVDGSNARAGADFPMNARRSATGTPAGTDPVIGSGLTDASGFVSVPIPTGLASGSGWYAYLGAA